MSQINKKSKKKVNSTQGSLAKGNQSLHETLACKCCSPDIVKNKDNYDYCYFSDDTEDTLQMSNDKIISTGTSADPVTKKICDICSNQIRSSGIKCSYCCVIVHAKCFDIVSKLFIVNKENWRCKNCTIADVDTEDIKLNGNSRDEIITGFAVLKKENEGLLREIELLNQLVKELQNVNNLLQPKLEEISATKTVSNSSKLLPEKSDATSSYSSVLKNLVQSNENQSSDLFIKNRDPKTKGNILKDIKNKINPTKLNICVTKTIETASGLIIKCEDQESLNKLKENLQANFNEKFTVNESKNIKPRIIIHNVENEVAQLNDEELKQEIITRNKLGDTNSTIYLKIVKRLKSRYTSKIVIEVEKVTRDKIIKNKYLYLCWSKCPCEDHLLITRCYKCSQHGHVKQICKNSSVVCPNCASNHELRECRSEIKKCINCVNFNIKHKTDVDTCHSCLDVSKCSAYNYKVEILKSKIYGNYK